MPRLLIISTEPAPYKTDLYNAFCEVPGLQVIVFYALTEDWESDAGHDFRSFPERKYKYFSHHGKGLWGQLGSAFRALKVLNQTRPNLLLICTLNRLPYVTSVLIAILKKIPFAIWDDHFNLGSPRIRFVFATIARYLIRRLTFNHSQAILVCGQSGWDSAVQVGCPQEKLVNFPYVVDSGRLRKLSASSNSIAQLPNAIEDKPIIFFSGRMIERKGLEILMRALQKLQKEKEDVFLIAEGEGPLKKKYEMLAIELGLKDKICFVGFSQMDRHAYFLSIADIVVVPSIYDPWGIVVHEGMLMGKAVCASDAVVSAGEMIVNGINGFIFASGNWNELANMLKRLLEDQYLGQKLGMAAEKTAALWSPKRNVESFLAFIQTKGILGRKSLCDIW